MSDKQGDMHRWLVSELRARGFDETNFYKEDSVAVQVRLDDGVVAVIYAHWFERRYMDACARRGVTYLLPEGGDVVAACIEWAASQARNPPPEVWGADAPPEVVAQFGLKQLSRAENKAWFEAMGRAMKRMSRKMGER